MLVDAHAHIDRFGDRFTEAIEQIEVHRILTVAVAMDVPSYLATKALARCSSYIRPIFGMHPWEALQYADDLTALDEHLAETPMIGEASSTSTSSRTRACTPASGGYSSTSANGPRGSASR